MRSRLAALAAVLLLAAGCTAVGATENGRKTRTGTATVIIANGWSLPDVGVAASMAAALDNAVVIYGSTGGLGNDEVSILRDYQPSTVVLVGGTAVLDTGVEDRVRREVPGVELRRVSGEHRRSTAALAAREVLGEAFESQVDASYACRATTSMSPAYIDDNGRRRSSSSWRLDGSSTDNGADCEWTVLNDSGAQIRVAVQIQLNDTAGTEVPRSASDTIDGGLLIGAGQTATFGSDAVTHEYSAWQSSGSLVGAWCRYWTDTSLVQYPGDDFSQPCNIMGSGRATG